MTIHEGLFYTGCTVKLTQHDFNILCNLLNMIYIKLKKNVINSIYWDKESENRFTIQLMYMDGKYTDGASEIIDDMFICNTSKKYTVDKKLKNILQDICQTYYVNIFNDELKTLFNLIDKLNNSCCNQTYYMSILTEYKKCIDTLIYRNFFTYVHPLSDSGYLQFTKIIKQKPQSIIPLSLWKYQLTYEQIITIYYWLYHTQDMMYKKNIENKICSFIDKFIDALIQNVPSIMINTKSKTGYVKTFIDYLYLPIERAYAKYAQELVIFASKKTNEYHSIILQLNKCHKLLKKHTMTNIYRVHYLKYNELEECINIIKNAENVLKSGIIVDINKINYQNVIFEIIHAIAKCVVNKTYEHIILINQFENIISQLSAYKQNKITFNTNINIYALLLDKIKINIFQPVQQNIIYLYKK